MEGKMGKGGLECLLPAVEISGVGFGFEGGCEFGLEFGVWVFGVQVRLLDFSPGEKFLVTYSTHEPAGPREKQVGPTTEHSEIESM